MAWWLCLFIQAPFQSLVKGIVHPKMKILSSFTHPQVVPNLYECLCSAGHKRRYFWRLFVTRLFWGTIDFHSRKPKYYGSQWCPRTALFPSFFRISSFVFSRTNTFIQVWNYLRVSKWWQNFHFWVNYPFNYAACEDTFVCIMQREDNASSGKIYAKLTILPTICAQCYHAC